MSLSEAQINSIMNEDNDDMPKLSAETLKALQEFLIERESKEKAIDENWQLSQFWYDKNTSETLAKEVFTLAIKSLESSPSSTFNIGCISCPTLFKTLHYYLKDAKTHPTIESFEKYVDQIDIKVFEYDKRFEVYGNDFIFYDYKEPLNFNVDLYNYFDIIVADPPFLADECHIKTGMTIKKIGKSNYKLIICTGAVMEDLLSASLNVELCSFKPKHERNLANEFKCFANYKTLFLNS